jgi:hypothetical protein
MSSVGNRFGVNSGRRGLMRHIARGQVACTRSLRLALLLTLLYFVALRPARRVPSMIADISRSPHVRQLRDPQSPKSAAASSGASETVCGLLRSMWGQSAPSAVAWPGCCQLPLPALAATPSPLKPGR